MFGRDDQPARERDEPEGRQELARDAGRESGTHAEKKPVDPRPASEQKAETGLLKSSGGDPFTQESD